MPKRTDIRSILVIGAGPIVIGQACEFDYSGTQGCKALRAEGFKVILVNSNPATIMTDPEMADRIYIEPVVPEVVARIIEKERPDAILPTLGGQTALNVTMALHRQGVLEKYGVKLLGASVAAIDKSEDRALFRDAMAKIGLKTPKSVLVHNLEEARRAAVEVGFPAILRPAFTLGGTGGGIVYRSEDYDTAIRYALSCSPVSQVLVEQSVIGWKEYELEVMRDLKDNVVIICSIENVDPMGVHTGDSITVAPAQTLTDKEYERMRDAAIAIIREIGVATGGSNIQFSVNPKDGEMMIIEMNPRVSRSSALASKATGFPIAKFAAKLAVGYTLDEIQNDITKTTPASFEPTIDYVVTKLPRFNFEKFPGTDTTLTTQMKSVGEVMAIGRTFKESLQKGLRALETGLAGLDSPKLDGVDIRKEVARPSADRLLYVAEALRQGVLSEAEVYKISGIDPWFLAQIGEILAMEKEIATLSGLSGDAAPLLLRDAKRMGFSDRRLAQLLFGDKKREGEVRAFRYARGLRPVYKRVDTCAAEFEAHTPYLYSTYESECEVEPTAEKKIIILGGGPNRIGQGIEFDYCCVHACFGLKKLGYETIMVNCNPETVSTDYDTADRLYFEPLTLEDVLHIVEIEKPVGVIVQLGGQTPLKLALSLEAAGVPILGTPPEWIDCAEDRERFQKVLVDLDLRQPQNGCARNQEEARRAAVEIGYPVVVRPSYVLGGRGMEIVYDEKRLDHYMREAVFVSEDRPVLIDQYLIGAIEVDVDALSDGKTVVIAGIMEHIEEAGIHSGDSACCLPPYSLSEAVQQEIIRETKALARALHVCGLMNIQFAVVNDAVYLLEVNPRASRTVPFVAKATGFPIAQWAAQLMSGKTFAELGIAEIPIPSSFSVKEAVFPFSKFPHVDPVLGPEMKSTGEVMGRHKTFGVAYAKAQMAASNSIPTSGRVFVSVRDADKANFLPIARSLSELGFSLCATEGTASYFKREGLSVFPIKKVHEGSPHVKDAMQKGEIQMVLNTHEGAETGKDAITIRRASVLHAVPYFTTLAAARAVVQALKESKEAWLEPIAL